MSERHRDSLMCQAEDRTERLTEMHDHYATFGGMVAECAAAFYRLALDLDPNTCPSTIARRYGSAACDLRAGHDGLHTQHATGISWTTDRAVESWLEDDA